jgi:hypothetical protein
MPSSVKECIEIRSGEGGIGAQRATVEGHDDEVRLLRSATIVGNKDAVVKNKDCIDARNKGSSLLVCFGTDVQISPGYEVLDGVANAPDEARRLWPCEVLLNGE